MSKKLVTFFQFFSWALTAFLLAYSLKNNYFLGIFVSVIIILSEVKRLLKKIISSRKSNLELYGKILMNYYFLKFIQYSSELEEEERAEFKEEVFKVAEDIEKNIKLLLKDGILGKKRKEELKNILTDVKELKELNKK